MSKYIAVADPGFPVGGGRGPRRGGVDSRGGYVSKILYVKMKEFGPLGGACAGHAPYRSANVLAHHEISVLLDFLLRFELIQI